MSITPDVLEQIADELHGIPDNEAKISFPCPTHGAFAASISLTGPEKLEASCADGCETKALWRGLVKESATLARLWAEKSREKEEKPKARASGPGAEVKHDNEKSGLMQPPRPETQEDDPDIRVPTRADEAERAVLGAVMIPHVSMERRRQALDTASLILSPEDFYLESYRHIYRAMLRLDERHATIDHVTVAQELKEHGHLEYVGRETVIDLLDALASPIGIEDYAKTVHEAANLRKLMEIGKGLATAAHQAGPLKAMDLVVQAQQALTQVNGNVAPSTALIAEGYDDSLILNAEYLARPEIIERLGYSQSITLMIGAKHHGKTTNIRTLALSVMRGLPIWERKTYGGYVIYAASDDEVASTRNELLKMGWSKKGDPLEFVHINPDSDAGPQDILDEIAELAVRRKAVMVILDMLFDFVGIRNELSYAETRSAIGMVQRLADQTKCLVVGSHHTPKYLTDIHNAANAALGSQGISARFSPIILTRKWTETLYTVESTTTRDPRGQELKPMKIVKNDQGWIETAGEFKDWMKWEMYADRILGLFEGGDPTHGHTVADVARKLEIDRSRAQNALYQLEKAGKLKRDKQGRAYKYYLSSTDMFDRKGGSFGPDDKDD